MLEVNYFELHIGDYQRKTAHLTLAEHGAYSLMLQTFYSSERPLPLERKVLYRLLRADTAAERKAIDSVITQFWEATPAGLSNKRAEEVVGEYRAWVEKQKANGGRGGRPPKSETKPNGNPSVSQTQPKVNPCVPQTETQTKAKPGTPILTTHLYSPPPTPDPDPERAGARESLRERSAEITALQMTEKPSEKGRVGGDFRKVGSETLSPDANSLLHPDSPAPAGKIHAS